MADSSDVLEHCYAAKQHLVHIIRGTHNGDLERGMRNQRPTLDITRSNQYQVHAPVDKVKSHSIQSARDNIAELYDLHRFESAAERLEFIDFLLVDKMKLCPVAERVEGGERDPNPPERVSNSAHECPESTALPGGTNPRVDLQQISSLSE